MDYQRFSQLWDALITNNPKFKNVNFSTDGMTDKTAIALIEYGQGNKSKIESIRKSLSR